MCEGDTISKTPDRFTAVLVNYKVIPISSLASTSQLLRPRNRDQPQTDDALHLLCDLLCLPTGGDWKTSDGLGKNSCSLLPRRWVVERTFGWLMRQRRLVRDYERTVSSAEAWIHLAMIRIQLRRLA